MNTPSSHPTPPPQGATGLAVLRRVLDAMAQADSPEAAASTALAETVALTGAAAAVFYGYDDESALLQPLAVLGAPVVELPSLPLGEGLAGQAALACQPMRSQDGQETLAYPLRVRERLLGVLQLSGAVLNLSGIELVLDVLALAWDNVRLHEKVDLHRTTDPLTGLHNRRYMDERLEVEFSRAFRYGTELSLLLVEVDGLDSLRQAAGEQMAEGALKRAAHTLKITLRDSDLCARVDEIRFSVALPHTRRDDAMLVADKVRAALRAECPAVLSLAIGGACYPDSDALALSELMDKAEHALSLAREQGGGAVIA